MFLKYHHGLDVVRSRNWPELCYQPRATNRAGDFSLKSKDLTDCGLTRNAHICTEDRDVCRSALVEFARGLVAISESCAFRRRLERARASGVQEVDSRVLTARVELHSGNIRFLHHHTPQRVVRMDPYIESRRTICVPRRTQYSKRGQ